MNMRDINCAFETDSFPLKSNIIVNSKTICFVTAFNTPKYSFNVVFLFNSFMFSLYINGVALIFNS